MKYTYWNNKGGYHSEKLFEVELDSDSLTEADSMFQNDTGMSPLNTNISVEVSREQNEGDYRFVADMYVLAESPVEAYRKLKEALSSIPENSGVLFDSVEKAYDPDGEIYSDQDLGQIMYSVLESEQHDV
jgi:hypothetical protein